MARLPLDFSKIQDNAFPIFPVGSYTLLIKEARQEAAKSSGELKLSVKFEVVDGPGGSNEFAGKTVFASYSLQEKAAFRVRKLCAAAGMSKEEIDAGVDDELLTGRTIKADLAVEKYNGRDTNRVQNEMPLTTNGASVVPGSFAPSPSGFKMPGDFASVTNFGNAAAPTPPPAKPVE